MEGSVGNKPDYRGKFSRADKIFNLELLFRYPDAQGSYDSAVSGCAALSTSDCPVRILPVSDFDSVVAVPAEFTGKTLRLEGQGDTDKWLNAKVGV